MSKARLVITAVVLQGRSQAEVARSYGVSKGWVSKLVTRYRAEGEAAFEPRSRAPHTHPNAVPDSTVALVTGLRARLVGAGLDAGPETIAWHLHREHQIRLARSTIARILTRAGLVTPAPRKRPKSSYIRFQADQPNECWQSDFTHVRLENDTPAGADVEVLAWLDDHSRYLLSLTCHRAVTVTDVVATFLAACAKHGIPQSTLTDNGLVYTARHRGGRNAFEHQLRQLNVQQKNSRPNHPTTCGKVERLHQTLKRWLAARPRPVSINDLQQLLDAFVTEYNEQRPHRSLQRRTPLAAYRATPKAGPAGTDTAAQTRVRTDRVDKAGKVTLRVNGTMFHIAVGRTHARTRIKLLVHDLDVTIIDATTGELLTELSIDPTRRYQPLNSRKPPNP
jgi:transposase InsO family protein